MTEYTYKDIIIDPEDLRIEIGKDYYFADNPTKALNKAKNAFENISSQLLDVNIGSEYPFIASTGYKYACIILSRDEGYRENQSEWIKENNIKIGDKVKVVRKFQAYENWSGHYYWLPAMNSYIENTAEIINITKDSIRVMFPDNCVFDFPYFTLTPTEDNND